MHQFSTVIAVILAAGRSARMGGGENKVLRPLGDRSVLSYSLETFQNCSTIDRIVVVGREEDRSAIEGIVRTCCPKAIDSVTNGGAERFESVKLGLEFGRRFNPDAVLIHDSARPFVEERYILSSLSAAAESRGSVVGVPLKDTLKETDSEGCVVNTPDRSRFWLAQTPQTFRFDDILNAYRACSPPPYPTDDGAVLELSGGKVKMVEGSYHNMKLTTPEDWMLAEAILEIRRKA